MPSGITLAIRDLIKSGNADKEPATLTVHAGFDIQDIYPLMKHLFNPQAVATLENKTHSMIHQFAEYVGPKGFENFHKVESLMEKLGLRSVQKQYTLTGDWWVRNCDKVNLFGSTCSLETMPKAVEKVIVAINDVASRGFTKASLMSLGVMQFLPVDKPDPQYLVLSYITLTQAGEQYVAQNMPKMTFYEGGIPERVENQ